MIKVDILTIFPHILDSYINESIIKRALRTEVIDIKFWDIRDYTIDKHRSVDDAPYGGGPGMIFKIEPIFKGLKKAVGDKILTKKIKNQKSKIKMANQNLKIILLSPKGEQFTQKKAQELSAVEHLVLICGRYEGIDARIEYLVDEQISIGPYILSGGELPAMIVIEALTRLLPGVLGSADSLIVESYNLQKEIQNNKVNQQSDLACHIVEYPQYTRPSVFEPIAGIKWEVPQVLLSGDHKKIEEWRKAYMGKKLNL